MEDIEDDALAALIKAASDREKQIKPTPQEEPTCSIDDPECLSCGS